MNVNLLEKAIALNGVTHIVISKVDVLRAVGVWKMIENEEVITFESEEAMKNFIVDKLTGLGIKKSNIFFSESKEGI